MSGEPLIGVTITSRGDANGTITGVDGSFSIKCSRGANLKFSYIGYEDVQRKAIETTMSITMKEAMQTLDEVVVVGYGVQKKRDITGAITSVSSKKPWLYI